MQSKILLILIAFLMCHVWIADGYADNASASPLSVSQQKVVPYGTLYPSSEHSDAVDPRNWGRATQTIQIDEQAGLMYVLSNRKDGRNRMTVLHWDEKDPRKRTFLASSGWLSNIWCHQGFALAGKDALGRQLFWASGSGYNAEGKKEPWNLLELKLVVWDPFAKTKASVVRSWRLWEEKNWKHGNIDLCVTPDGRFLLASATNRSDFCRYVHIWETSTLLQMDSTEKADASLSFIREFKVPYVKHNPFTQSCICDGKYIYGLDSSAKFSPHHICIMDMYGNKIKDLPPGMQGAELQQDVWFHIGAIEGESLILAHLDGKLCLLLSVNITSFDGKKETSPEHPGRITTLYKILECDNVYNK